MRTRGGLARGGLAALMALLGSASMLWVGACAFTLVSIAPTAAIAQDDDDDDAPADDAPAEDTAEDTTSDGGGDTGKKPPKSWLAEMIDALGWLYGIIFLALSFTLVALIVMNLLTARRDNVVPVHLVEGFEAHLNEKRYQDAYELAKNDESFLGNVLSAGLAKLSAGYPQAIEAMQEVGEEENMKLEHRLSYLALIGTVSPMLGLVGTVHGMIASFRTIAGSTGQPPIDKLALGISKALYTTIIGLLIAIPAIAAFNLIKNKVQRLVLEVGIMSESLMSRFENVGKK